MEEGRLTVAARLATTLLVVAVLSCSAAFAAEQAVQPRSERETEVELELIRDEIARLSGRLNAVRQQRAGLAGELARVDLELELLVSQLAEATTARNLAALRAETSIAAIGELEQTLIEVRNDLRDRLTGLYRLGSQGLLRLVLAVEVEGDLLPAIRQLRFLARRDGRALDRYLDTKTRLLLEREELDRRRLEAEAWLAREEQRKIALEAARKRQATLLARVEEEQRRLTARTSELADQERKLAELLDVLFGRVDAADLAGRPMRDFRGVLEWPVAGRISVPFGPRLDPRYGTRVPHNGVELAVAAGSPVRVVYPGSVLYAAPFEGYGDAVVVAHAGRVLTLYAGLERITVAKGDVVSFKAEVGRASAKLYFEIRVENRPEDPRQWLR